MQNRKGNYHEKKTISFIDNSGTAGRYAGRMRFFSACADRGSFEDRGACQRILTVSGGKARGFGPGRG